MSTHLYGEPLSYLNVNDSYNAPSYSMNRETINGGINSGDTEYHVTFKIEYPTKFYEDLFVVGDLPELGGPNDLKKHPLKWTDGHVWVSEKPVVTYTPNFRYNYIMIDQKSGQKIDHDEKGIKRICDLASIDSHGASAYAGVENKNAGYHMTRQGKQVLVDICDIWQILKVKFTVLHTQTHGAQTIRLSGNIPELGNWNKINPIALSPELTHAHDELIPYSVTINMKVPEVNKAFNMRYSYSLWEDNSNAEWERDPARSLEILPSEEYHGQLGQTHSHQFVNTGKVFFVNGMIDKHDGFFHRDFVICQVGNL